MGLPIQKAQLISVSYLYQILTVEFRPFLVKEQNHLLVARESES